MYPVLPPARPVDMLKAPHSELVMRSTRPMSLRAATLLALPFTLLAQAQPQGAAAGAGMLTGPNANAAAVAELRGALAEQFQWSFLGAKEKLDRALEMQPTFGVARAIRAWVVGGPTAAAETQKGAADAVSGTAAEAALAMAYREQAAGRAENARRFANLATELAPNDRDVAFLRAILLADTARTNALRDLAAKSPEDANVRAYLAFFLMPPGVDSVVEANAAEASRVAMEAVRLAPQSATTHTAIALVLNAQRKYAEAQPHLLAAARMQPRSAPTYEGLAQTYAVDGRYAEMRAALDTAAALSANVGNQFFYRRPRALTHLSEGGAQTALAELAQQVKDAEAINARGQLAQTHLWMALVSAGARDSAGAEQHLAAARTFEPGAGLLADNEVIVYTLIGNATQARRALNDYVRLSGPQPNLPSFVNSTRTQNVHRQTGLVLVAEKKPAEAIVELRQGGTNPYATLGVIEALTLQKKTREADAERAAFFQRKQFSFNSSATPIIRYRAMKKK